MSTATALVTGGSRGIGARICQRLAHEGFDVALGYEQSETKASQVAEGVEGTGSRALVLPGDVGDPLVREQLVERTVRELDGIDVLVNNAGVRDASAFLDVAPGSLERSLHVDVAATFHLTQLAGERMVEQGGGSIVNVAAAAGIEADPLQATLSIAKAGVLALTRTAAIALAPDVNVNAVAPGFVPTKASRHLDGEAREAIEEQTPAGRWTSKAEVADAVTYLTQAPNTVTGEVLRLDGGLSSQLYALASDVDHDEDLGDLELPGIEQTVEGPPDSLREEVESADSEL